MSYYKLTDCNDSQNIIYTDTDLENYVSKVISIEESNGCFLVEETDVVLPDCSCINITINLDDEQLTFNGISPEEDGSFLFDGYELSCNGGTWSVIGESPSEGCDCISVTYQLEGEDPVTVEVEKESDFYTVEGIGTIEKVGSEWRVLGGEETNCDNFVNVTFTYLGIDYNFNLPKVGEVGGNNAFLYTDGSTVIEVKRFVGSWFVYITIPTILITVYFNSGDDACPFYPSFTVNGSSTVIEGLSVQLATIIYATLSEDTPCPFGTYTIEEGSIFEAFSVAPCNIPTTLATLTASCDCAVGTYAPTQLSPFRNFIVDYCVQPTIITPTTFDICYPNCEECNQPLYRLTGCSNSCSPIFSTDERLKDLVDLYVKVPYYNYSCFLVERVPWNYEVHKVQYLDFTNNYFTCEDCAQQETIEPKQTNLCDCDEDKVLKIKCTFVDAMYQKMISRRLGIEHCCPIDFEQALIRNNKVDYDLLCAETPSLKPPKPDVCCIQPTPCVPQICEPCNQTVQAENCNCKSSGEESPHPCNEYTFLITTEQLTLAIGNQEDWKNGKVFLAYFPCKKEDAIVKSFNSPTSETLCVLGEPLFGYFAQDNFVEVTVQSSDICEPKSCCP
jgi:hypothetical protein